MIRISAFAFALCCASVLAVPPTPVADPSGIPKSRYISMSVPDNGGEPSALRVTLTSLMHPNPPNCCQPPPDFTAFEGEYRWVGPPVFSTENDNDPTPFIAAPLQCTPYYHNWTTLGLFHVYGDAVVPSSNYNVIAFDQSCAGTEDICVDISSDLQLLTVRFGDVAPPYDSANTNGTDYFRVIDKIQRLPALYSKASLQMYGDILSPTQTVNVRDSATSFTSFDNFAYPFAGPTSCSGARSETHIDASMTARSGATLKAIITPVPPKGTLTYPAGTQISGQNLVAPSGDFTAFLNVQVQDWNPGNSGPDLRALQFQIDPESLLGVNAFPPAPGVDVTLASRSCTSVNSCRSEFGEAGPSCTAQLCQPVYVAFPFQSFTAPEHVFEDFTHIPFGTSLSPTGPIFASTRTPGEGGPVDDGQRKYIGTLVLDIPAEAAGHRYTVRIRTGSETLAVAGEQLPTDLPIAETVSAVLDIGTASLGLDFNRSRFISFVPGHSGEQMAIRVKLVSLHHVSPPYAGGPSVPFSSFEGQYRWVGPPTQFVESVISNDPFYAASLQCDPHYRDWNSTGYLHVTGSAIVPSSQYEVQFVPASCMGSEEACPDISSPILRETARWADVETPFNPPALSIQPDLADVSALVNKFRGAPGAPIKARALLAGFDPAGNISLTTDLSFIHISACVDAFRGQPYPHTGPQACP